MHQFFMHGFQGFVGPTVATLWEHRAVLVHAMEGSTKQTTAAAAAISFCTTCADVRVTGTGLGAAQLFWDSGMEAYKVGLNLQPC